MGDLPAETIRTLSSSTSTPTTVCPASARQPAVTLPTYPRPKTLTRIDFLLVLLVSRAVLRAPPAATRTASRPRRGRQASPRAGPVDRVFDGTTARTSEASTAGGTAGGPGAAARSGAPRSRG